MNFPVLRKRFAESLSHYNALLQSGLLKPEPPPLVDQPVVDERRILRNAGVPDDRLDQLQRLAGKWCVSLREAAFAAGSVRPDDYVQSAAQLYFVENRTGEQAVDLVPISPPPAPYRLLQCPSPTLLQAPHGDLALNAEYCDPEIITEIVNALGPDRRRLKLLSRAAMTATIIKCYGADIVTRAANGIWQRNPRFSAATGFICWQIVALAIVAGLFAGAFIFAPREVLLLYGGILSLLFLIVIALRTIAAIYTIHRRIFHSRPLELMLSDRDLPRYTVLVALFHEARVLPQLVKALAALDYPAAKLDIKLVLEEVDKETIARARAMTLPPHFEILIVPDGVPRTKPRALNYALQFASGEFLVIYDAEDRPDPQQLRMAATRFTAAPEDVVCLQAQLILDNHSQNWLAKQFTIEYASLFGGILPLLDKARVPMPLGGTSNHFRIDTLRRLGAWDAHNVTEDADLGMRIYRAGLRAEVLFSETLEEAACQPGNWLRQRTRWLKGWMQTYLVHMRQPKRLLCELGLVGFLAFHGHFAGIILAALIYPVSYILIAYGAMTGWFLSQPQSILGHHLLVITVVNLIAGFIGSFALGVFVLKRRHLAVLLPQIPLIPAYWLLISVAAYRALYQLLTAPHYWEKTEHFGVRVRTRRPRGTQARKKRR